MLMFLKAAFSLPRFLVQHHWAMWPALAVLVLAMYPQMRLWQAVGRDWQGNYAYNDIDEVAYAAYLNALADGRPRRADPYAGYDNPTAESIFSVQIATPYPFAQLTKVFGGQGPLAMLLVTLWTGLATGLALFWLITLTTQDARWGMMGAIVVICCGTIACGQGAIGTLLGGTGPAYPFLPALRRYIPAGAGPFLWLGAAFLWQAVHARTRRRQTLATCAAGLCFAVLVFSYFYLWTLAAAWAGVLAVLWWTVRRDCGRVWLGLGALGALALLPYAALLSRRGTTTDGVQLLERTHAPDLLRGPELLGLLGLLLICTAVWSKRTPWRNPLTLFALATALTPLVVFNQQIITGHSLQPIHYEVFTGNYVAVLAVLLALALWRPNSTDAVHRTPRNTLVLVTVAIAAFAWGIYEARTTSAVLDDANLQRDRMMPVLRGLREVLSVNGDEPRRAVVFTDNFLLADELPTVAPQAVLWARHLPIFAGASHEESIERFFQQIYWLGLTPEDLAAHLTARNFVVVYALFGWGRLGDRLVRYPQPLTENEINTMTARYADYCARFDRATAARVPLSYVILSANSEFNWTRLEQWYTRDAGTTYGDFVLYRVALK